MLSPNILICNPVYHHSGKHTTVYGNMNLLTPFQQATH